MLTLTTILLAFAKGFIATLILMGITRSVVKQAVKKDFEILNAKLNRLLLIATGTTPGQYRVVVEGEGLVESPYDVQIVPSGSLYMPVSMPLTPEQQAWLNDNGPFEPVTCQPSATVSLYLNPETGKTVKITYGAGLPEAY